MNNQEIIATFHITRGGRFNNAGHLVFCGTDNSSKKFAESKYFVAYEDQQGNTRLAGGESGVIKRNEQVCYVSESNNFIGYVAEDGEEFRYEEDGQYDTLYGKELWDCDIHEIGAILRAGKHKWSAEVVDFIKDFHEIDDEMWEILDTFDVLQEFMQRGYTELDDIDIEECTEADFYDHEVGGRFYIKL